MTISRLENMVKYSLSGEMCSWVSYYSSNPLSDDPNSAQNITKALFGSFGDKFFFSRKKEMIEERADHLRKKACMSF